MAVLHGQVVVEDEATVVAAAGRDRDGVTVTVQNPAGGASVFLGGPTVTSTVYGNALAAGSSITVMLKQGETLYGIVATGTITVNVLRVGA
jgi:LysM repeat protein